MSHQPTLRLDLDLLDSLGRRLHPEAVVVQEDRNLVLAAPTILDLDEVYDLDSAYRAVSAHRPLTQGRYLLMRPSPERPFWTYQAVVHDLELNPTCRPGDVRRSLSAVLSDVVRRGLRVLSVEPLGMLADRGLSTDEMVEAFDAAILELSIRLVGPLRLVLLLGDLGTLEEVSHRLRSLVLRKASRSFRTVNGDAAVVEVRRADARLHVRFVPGSLSGYMVTRVSNVA